MSRGSRAYLAGCAALIAYALGYALPTYARLPNLYYDPIARHFLVGERPGPIPMGYLGQVLFGAASALLVGFVAWFAAGGRGREPSPTTFGLLAAWVLTAVAIVGAYFTWNNWP